MLKLQAVVIHLMWVLGTELRFSTKTACYMLKDTNLLSLSPPPDNFVYFLDAFQFSTHFVNIQCIEPYSDV